MVTHTFSSSTQEQADSQVPDQLVYRANSRATHSETLSQKPKPKPSQNQDHSNEMDGMVTQV